MAQIALAKFAVAPAVASGMGMVKSEVESQTNNSR